MSVNAASAMPPCHTSCPDHEQYVSHKRAAIARLVRDITPRRLFAPLSWLFIDLPRQLGSQEYPYWSQIAEHVYVGAIPMASRNHVEKIKELGVTAILSVLEAHELEPSCAREPVSPATWKEHGVTPLRLDTPDLEPLSVENLAKGVDFIADELKKGGTVYIHCNSGRGRSLLMSAAYLVSREKRDFCDILSTLKQQRPQMMLSGPQMDQLERFFCKCPEVQTDSA